MLLKNQRFLLFSDTVDFLPIRVQNLWEIFCFQLLVVNKIIEISQSRVFKTSVNNYLPEKSSATSIHLVENEFFYLKIKLYVIFCRFPIISLVC